MTRILFADSDENVLHSLRRNLHAMRGEWDMIFAGNSQEVLHALSEIDDPVDIVVADLAMPGSTEAGLIEEVRALSPETVRIALSHGIDKDTALHAAGKVHQLVPKLCGTETLKTILQKACHLRSLLTNERLRELVSRMQTLPSVSQVYAEVTEELQKPEASIQIVGESIAQDAGLSGKVLQLVNSALFALPHTVSDPAHGAALLGLDTMRMLVLSAKIFDHFVDQEDAAFVTRVWRHSNLVARLAKRIAQAEGATHETAECAFLSGLLHDVGWLVFAANMPERMRALTRLANASPDPRHELERRIFSATHGELAGYLVGLWGLPEETVQAITFHESPSDDPSSTFTTLTALHAANGVVSAGETQSELELCSTLDHAYLERLGLTQRIPAWQSLHTAPPVEGDHS